MDFVSGLKVGEVAIISTTLGVISVHESIAMVKCFPRDYVIVVIMNLVIQLCMCRDN